MCNQNIMPLSLNGDTFNVLKTDFDSILRNTISNMELKGADIAEMNVKLKISLAKEQTRDFDASYDGAMRDIVRPKFEHAVQSVLQIKDKKDGTLAGNYELVWDVKEQKYVMREITDDQTSLFDKEKASSGSSYAIDANYVVVCAGDEQQPVLHGRKLSQLPAPAVDEAREADLSPFEWLLQFADVKMKVVESEGVYTVIARSDNTVVLSSGADTDSPFYVSADKLEPHLWHTVACEIIGDENFPVCLTFYCDDCGDELLGVNLPEPIEDDTAGEGQEGNGEDDGYEYEPPEDSEV